MGGVSVIQLGVVPFVRKIVAESCYKLLRGRRENCSYREILVDRLCQLGESKMNTLITEGLITPQTSQVTLFLRPGKAFKIVPIASASLQELSLLFDAEPSIFSVPSADDDSPQLILRQEEVGQLYISPKRADLVLECKHEDRWQGVVASTAEALVRALVDKNGLSVQRLGFVLTFDLNDKINPADIQKRYLNERIAEASGINLAWHRQIFIDGVAINRWVRLFNEPTPDGLHTLVIDQNTAENNDQDISASQVGQYVTSWQSLLWSEIDGIIEW